MDLSFTPEEQAFRERMRHEVAALLPPDIAHKVKHGLRLHKEDHQRWARALGQRGWLGWNWPREFGGPGWSAIERHLFEEACAWAGAPRVMPFGPVMVAPVIMAFGTTEQQQRFLPGIASGEVWWCQGYSEPGSGSDLASLSTTAVRDGDEYVVNGQKTWTTLAQHADWMFCLVRTDTQVKPQAGISFLLIDMKSPGVTVRPIRLLDGEAEVNEVWLDGVRVPVNQRVGEENRGWDCAKYLLGHERTNIADVNRSKREVERLKRLAQQLGEWENPRLRDQLATLEAEVVALEMMVLRVLAGEQTGRRTLDVAGLLKIRGSEIQQQVAELMLQVAGPRALVAQPEALDLSPEHPQWAEPDACAPLAASHFNLRKTTIYGGSNEVQRNIVAQTLFG